MLALYWKRFKQNAWAVTGSIIIMMLVLVALGAHKISPHDPLQQNLLDRLQAPSRAHWCGTDDFGRDVFSRILVGTQVSLRIGFIAALISLSIGTLMGLFSGYWRGWVDAVIMRLVDVILCFPTMFLILMIIGIIEKRDIGVVIAVIALTSWPGLARMVRGEVLSMRERDFMLVAKGLGLPTPRIMFVHLLPNVITPVLVAGTFAVGGAILAESALSFLGLGVQPANPSWGKYFDRGKRFHPCGLVVISLSRTRHSDHGFGFYLLGEGWRDVLDPRL